MRILHLVDLFWDEWIGVPEFHHLLDEGDNVGGIETSATQGDLIKELAESDFVEEGGGVLEWEEPCFLHDHLKEEAAETLNCLD